MDRPSALDLAFLDLETPEAPLHVGWTLRFAGEPPPLAALRRHLDRRLGAVPRFRRRLVHAPLGLGGPVWADDPGFDVARHVYAATLPAPGGTQQLRELAGALLSPALPADRPLWRMYLVDGLHDGGFALIGQAHHALVDGIAAVEVALLLFGPEADGEAAAGWTPVPAPTAPAAAGATLRARAGAAARAVQDLAGALRAGSAAGGAEAVREGLRTLESVARPAPATALDRSATAERLLAYAHAPLDGVRETGRRHGATVNDVLLAACTLALRTALRQAGEAPASLRAMVPVSVREGEAAALGNRISFLPVELPVGEPDPLRVLRTVRSRTAAAKQGGEAGALQALTRAADALPGPGRRLIARTAARAVGFNLVISNVPGPPVELALLGRPLRSIHPMVPLLHGHALTIGAVSYAGRLNLGLAADAAVLPGVVDLGRGVEAAFDALRLAGDDPGGAEMTPWRARARARRHRAASR